jgi:hypothetical protein
LADRHVESSSIGHEPALVGERHHDRDGLSGTDAGVRGRGHNVSDLDIVRGADVADAHLVDLPALRG